MRDIESKICVISGNVVRSILERRWILFFQYLGIDFEYEPERFQDGVTSIGYLPDMLIHEELYLEIKPTYGIAVQEIERPHGFVRQTEKRLVIVSGQPPGDRMTALILDGGEIKHKDISWMSWETLNKKTDINICREKSAANYALNNVDIEIATPIARCMEKL